MKYNIVREDNTIRKAMLNFPHGELAPVEEAEWTDAVLAFVEHYHYESIPIPDTAEDHGRMDPDSIKENLRQMCKNAEKTHRFRRFLIHNREIKKWAIWLDIGCRSGFNFPEHPEKYIEAVRKNEPRGW